MDPQSPTSLPVLEEGNVTSVNLFTHLLSFWVTERGVEERLESSLKQGSRWPKI